jgi:hypothetical protein
MKKAKAKRRTEKVCVTDPRTGKRECFVPKKAKPRARAGTSDCGCGG